MRRSTSLRTGGEQTPPQYLRKAEGRFLETIDPSRLPRFHMEAIIKDEITMVLSEVDLFSPDQHGFIRGRSCLTNMLETIEVWTELLDAGLNRRDIIAYLDYRKAFDTVSYKRFVEKLKILGFEGTLLAWITDFCPAIYVGVGEGGGESGWVEVIRGVSQGWVLGPFLFLLFVNDIPDWVVNSINMFADDTKLWRSIAKLEDSMSLQEDLDRLMRWSDKWLLTFNPAKRLVMHIGHTLETEYYRESGGNRARLKATVQERDLSLNATNVNAPGQRRNLRQSCTLSGENSGN